MSFLNRCSSFSWQRNMTCIIMLIYHLWNFLKNDQNVSLEKLQWIVLGSWPTLQLLLQSAILKYLNYDRYSEVRYFRNGTSSILFSSELKTYVQIASFWGLRTSSVYFILCSGKTAMIWFKSRDRYSSRFNYRRDVLVFMCCKIPVKTSVSRFSWGNFAA